MNHYEILEVSPNASQEVIKAAYKSLMQRYHPDRNPGNAEIAGHASQVAQAYDVLSDSNRRAAYNIELEQQSANHLNNIPGRFRNFPTSSAAVAKASQSYWVLWLTVATIALTAWLALSILKKQQSPEAELKEIRQSFKGNQITPKQRQDKFRRIEEIFRDHPEILKKEASERSKQEEARIIPAFVEKLTVNLRAPDKAPENPGKSSDDPVRVLYIPMLGIKVGTFDAEKSIQYIENKKDLISQKLAEKLADAKYEELNKNDGEEYLKNIILDSIGETTGTNRFEDYPPSKTEAPGRYGAIEILLPKSFSVY